MANGNNYHPDCFQCTACHQPFTTARFQLKDGDPYHMDCYRTLFLPRCEVCEEFIPMNEAGSVVYKLVPFWDMKYCPSHEDNFRCCSCHRIEPSDPCKYFELLCDGRKLCHDCAMSVVLDTHEAQAVVKEVWQFMESLGISLPYVPVYLVEYPTLNEHKQGTRRSNGRAAATYPIASGHVTRGLCLSEVTEIQHMTHNGCNHVPQVVRLETNRSVNAILILHGLPYDLTAQVIAHEATHAFIKLHNGFPRDIPPMVEEGVCQLISYLWLKYKHVVAAESGEENAAFNARLREFFMHQIEHDTSAVYGDGFRRALDAYERTHSLQRIFDSIKANGCFP